MTSATTPLPVAKPPAPICNSQPQYSLKASGSQRTTSVLKADGFVEQAFVATGTSVFAVRVQANVLNAAAGTQQILSVEIRNDAGAVMAFSDGYITDQPGYRSFTPFSRSVSLTCGQRYRIRLVNRRGYGGDVVLGMDSADGYAQGAARSGGAVQPFNGKDANMLICTTATSCPDEPTTAG